jgi:hypothetical protein
MAAGMGSRFGGLKQMAPVGPDGASLMDYNLYDALQSGVDHVVFVIRPEMESTFKEEVLPRLPRDLEVDVVFQTLAPEHEQWLSAEDRFRTKPWGTGHALLCAAGRVRPVFGVVNADDFYGAESFKALGTALQTLVHERFGVLVGFHLERTLSPQGPVSRGVCQVNEEGLLVKIVETSGLKRRDTLIVNDTGVAFPGETPVSMNLWGFPASFLNHLTGSFEAFLRRPDRGANAEFLLPDGINAWMREQEAAVGVLRSPEHWLGLTFKEDVPAVKEALQRLVISGHYPSPLWPT